MPLERPEQQFKEPKDTPKTRAENTVSPQILGQIIHEAYGLKFDGSMTEPASLESLSERFAPKEIIFALKTGLLMESLPKLVETIDPGSFVPVQAEGYFSNGERTFQFNQPEDLKDEFGELNYQRLKLYLRGLIGQQVDHFFKNDFQEKRPNAFKIMQNLNEDEEVLSALDLGLDHILAMHQFIADRVDPELIGPSFEKSLPVLYKLARQEVFQALGLVKYEFKEVASPKEKVLFDRLAEHLRGLPTGTLNSIRRNTITDLLKLIEAWELKDPVYFDTAVDLESELEDTELFIDSLTGRRMPPCIAKLEAPEIKKFFTDELQSAYGRLDFLIAEEETLPDHLQSDLMAIRMSYSLTLADEFFEIVTDKEAVPHVELVAGAKEAGRKESSKLLRLPDDSSVPMDLAVPQTKTIGCAALHAAMPYTATLETMSQNTKFHPSKLNGIGLTTLLALQVIRRYEDSELDQKKIEYKAA